MNMQGRPDMVAGIEILDGEHFYENSTAQYGFRYVSSPDATGFSASIQGEVFPDALVVHGGQEYPLEVNEAYTGDQAARQLVATALFGYERDTTPHDEGQTRLDLPGGQY